MKERNFNKMCQYKDILIILLTLTLTLNKKRKKLEKKCSSSIKSLTLPEFQVKPVKSVNKTKGAT